MKTHGGLDSKKILYTPHEHCVKSEFFSKLSFIPVHDIAETFGMTVSVKSGNKLLSSIVRTGSLGMIGTILCFALCCGGEYLGRDETLLTRPSLSLRNPFLSGMEDDGDEREGKREDISRVIKV